MEERDLMEDLRKMILWLEDYQRFGGRMDPASAYNIMVLFEACRDTITKMQSEMDILGMKVRVHELGQKDRL